MGPCPKQRGRAFSDITHPAVERLFRISRSVGQECEHMRQFVRFQHLAGEGADVWFARVNPKASVVPLIMDHFVERLSVQPFIIYDEVHHIAGVYDGGDWYLVNTEGAGDLERALPDRTADEAPHEQAWRTFYDSVSIDARYNPELRRQFMPKRFWKNLTELQESPAALARATPTRVRRGRANIPAGATTALQAEYQLAGRGGQLAGHGALALIGNPYGRPHVNADDRTDGQHLHRVSHHRLDASRAHLMAGAADPM